VKIIKNTRAFERVEPDLPAFSTVDLRRKHYRSVDHASAPLPPRQSTAMR